MKFKVGDEVYYFGTHYISMQGMKATIIGVGVDDNDEVYKIELEHICGHECLVDFLKSKEEMLEMELDKTLGGV